MYSMKFFLVVSRTYIAEGEKTESLCGKCQNESREASPLSMFPFFFSEFRFKVLSWLAVNI